GVGFFFADAFFDCFRCAFNEVFGIFEAETGDFANSFDDLDFLAANVSEDDVEFGLLFSSGFAAAAASSCNSNRCCCAYAPLLFELFDEFGDLDDVEFGEEVDDLVACDIGHGWDLPDMCGEAPRVYMITKLQARS